MHLGRWGPVSCVFSPWVLLMLFHPGDCNTLARPFVCWYSGQCSTLHLVMATPEDRELQQPLLYPSVLFFPTLLSSSVNISWISHILLNFTASILSFLEVMATSRCIQRLHTMDWQIQHTHASLDMPMVFWLSVRSDAMAPPWSQSRRITCLQST